MLNQSNPIFITSIKDRLIPQPAVCSQFSQRLIFNPRSTTLQCDSPELLDSVAKRFIQKLKINQHCPNPALLITFSLKANNLPSEGYELQIQPDSILIRAKTIRGLNWGIQSFFQILFPDLSFPFNNTTNSNDERSWNLPCVHILDYPRFAYRGMHLDVVRHFFSVDEIKQFLLLMEAYKLNTFHWHLTDDQGWRIEIKRYPQLTQIASIRKSSPLLETPFLDDQFKVPSSDNHPYGPFFYTQDQIREVVAFAKDRGIEVIPEIEMPGHAQAALSVFPELGCHGPYEVWCGWGVSPFAFCPGNDEVFVFLQNIIDEIIPLFSSSFIHIGGDECCKSEWENCPRCQNKLQQLGLNSIHELQGYFISQIALYIESKGKHAIGWDEILNQGEIPNNTLIMAWRGKQYGINACQNHKVIMTPAIPLYFDQYQSAHFENEPKSATWTHHENRLPEIYAFDPIEGIPQELQSQVLGAQANCWSEYMIDFKNVQYMILPRMLALAEIVWTPKHLQNYFSFFHALSFHFRNFELVHFNFRKCASRVLNNLQWSSDDLFHADDSYFWVTPWPKNLLLPGFYSISFNYSTGCHALSIQQVAILSNGLPIASEKRASTVEKESPSATYIFQISSLADSANLQLAILAFGIHGIDSSGSILIQKI